MELRNKKGSQVGIIMSFTLFILSIMFIFSIVSPPVNIDKSKLYSMEVLEKNVLENISENIELVLINDPIIGDNCSSFSYSSLGISKENFIVKNSSGNEIESHSNSGNVYLEKDGTDDNFFKIYFSNGSFNNTLESTEENCDSSEIYYVFEKEIIVEENLVELINDYEEDYSSTKENLGIPVSEEFNLFFVNNNGTKIGLEREGLNTNIFAKTIQINYLDDKGNENIGELILKVW